MTKKVLEALNKARMLFGIESYPGNFFDVITKNGYDEKNKIILFREDIDNLSGFIGYSKDGYVAICVNCRHSIGRQNFTLAHEIGHWIMHNGVNADDDKSSVNERKIKFGDPDILKKREDEREEEANAFARELLYPEKEVLNDFFEAIQHDFFNTNKRKQLGDFVDKICHRHCISFELGLRCLLYKKHQIGQYATIKAEIEDAIGGKISEVYEKEFYTPSVCGRYMKPYEKLAKDVDILVKNNKIGEATGEAIKIRNGVEI